MRRAVVGVLASLDVGERDGDALAGVHLQGAGKLAHFLRDVRVELSLNDGHRLWSQITRDDQERLGLEHQQRVYVEPRRARVFAEVNHG